MVKRNFIFILGAVCILVIVAGYLTSDWVIDNTNNIPDEATADDATTDQVEITVNNVTTVEPEVTADNNVTIAEPEATVDDSSTSETETTPDDNTTSEEVNTTTDPSPDTNQSSPSTTIDFSSTLVAEALVDNKDDHDDPDDYLWNSSDVITITLNDNSISVDDKNGTIIDGTTINITSAGTYSISGTLNDGQIIIDTDDQEVIRLILDGVTISSSTKAPICVENADKTIIVLADDTENYLVDNENNQDNATILSKDDLTFYGNGSLTVDGKDNDAIHSNDGLVIKSGTITVTSVDDGICGKDYLVIKGGTIIVNSIGDGLKSNNAEEDKGYIYIEDGTINISSSQGDAITAETDLLITGGNFTLTSGGGSSGTSYEDISTKGLKSDVSIIIDDGFFIISSSDDSIHSDGVIVINNGTFDVATGDDGIHADISVEINDGIFNITKSFEGMESAVITINNGYIQIKSSNDGINLVEANTGSSPEGGFGGWPGDFAPSENCILYVNGGLIVVDSGADGVDSNGNIEMSDGILIIFGPEFGGRPEAAIDYGQGEFKITGGTLVAVGRADMAQAPSISSTQYSVNFYFSSTQPANNLVNIQTVSGVDLLTFCPTKSYQSLVFSSPELVAGTYIVYVGGNSTGTPSHGVYEDGTYSGGTNYGSFTIS